MAHLVEEGAEEEVPLLHRPERGLHLDRVHAARQVAVLERERRLDPLGRLLLQHLEQQVVGLRVVEAPYGRLQLRVRSQQRGRLQGGCMDMNGAQERMRGW